ncbi:MAG: TerB family tellurite resistance protein [Microcystaceae cyanobacterium]
MTQPNKQKQLLKILIGAAWIDGSIQEEERKFLRHMAQKYELIEDSEIKPLLSGLKPIQPSECYQYLENYLGDNPTEEDYQDLLGNLSGLIYSDGDVQTQEAQLLTKLQDLDPALAAARPPFEQVLDKIRQLYQRAIK